MGYLPPFFALLAATIVVLSSLYLVRCFRLKSKVSRARVLKDILVAAASAVLTVHALSVEQNIRIANLNNLPLLGGLYLVLHFALVFWLAFHDLGLALFRIPTHWAILFLYSSYLYYRSFAIPEYGLSTPILQGWIIGIALHRWRSATIRAALRQPLFYALGLWLLWVGASALLSHDTGTSLALYLDLLCFALASLVLAEDLTSVQAWKAAAAWVVVTAGILFGLLSITKFLSLSWGVGFNLAVRYRLFIADVGPNWISHSVAAVFPLAIVFFLESKGWQKRAWLACTLIMLAAILYTQSLLGLSGYFSLLAEGMVLVLLFKRKKISRWLGGYQRKTIYGLGAAVAIAAAVVLVFFSMSRNSYSVSGRFFIWDSVFRDIASSPVFGLGPGVRYTSSRNASTAVWENVVRQAPIVQASPAAHSILKQQAKVHAHNLFLEIARSSGIPAALAFLWFLWELGKKTYPFFFKDHRFSPYFYGCAAGLVGAVSWGMIDVMEYTPVFFTFPVWALVGMLLSAPILFQPGEGSAAQAAPVPMPAKPRKQPGNAWFLGSAAIVVLILLVASFVGNVYYQKGFYHFQSREWLKARESFLTAAKWNPLNAKYQELLAASYINLDSYDEALVAYEKAARLKRGYSPYLNQMGWLYWLKGDTDRAARSFQEAVQADPLEVWKAGLHADLGLLFLSQGREEESAGLFKKSIELSPEEAAETYWMPVAGDGGSFDVVIHPAYMTDSLPSENEDLKRRIYAHLGRADVTARNFRPFGEWIETVSLRQVLDAVKADYQYAAQNKPNEAQGLLAALAKASEWGGFYELAAETYRLYHQAYPGSPFGYRELSLMYSNAGDLDKAQEISDEAVSLFPRDGYSWQAAANISMNRGEAAAAVDAAEKLHDLQLSNINYYQILSQVHEQRGAIDKAAGVLKRELLIQDTVERRLQLADLLFQQGKGRQAEQQCFIALDRIRREKAHPLDRALRETGRCLARIEEETARQGMRQMESQDPFTAAILNGYRLQNLNRLEEAEQFFRKAAIVRPESPAPRFLLGQVYSIMGLREEAEGEFRRAFELNPLDPEPMLALGRLLWDSGDQSGAVEAYLAAEAAAPGWSDVHAALGNVYLQQGNDEKAAEQFRLAAISSGVKEGAWFHFAEKLPNADIQAPGASYIRLDSYPAKSASPPVIFMHPDSRASYAITLPDAGSIQLRFSAGLLPGSWNQEGDGVVFKITLHSGQSELELFNRYLDPKAKVEDRDWKNQSIDLSRWAGKSITITFETHSGPASDLRFDWAGWGDPVIMVQQAP